MAETRDATLDNFYDIVLKQGSLRTPAHAQRWSQAVLRSLGMNIDSSLKKQLANALPNELGQWVTHVFYLAHFRDTSKSQKEFLNEISRRSGNSDWKFARIPTRAVFAALKGHISESLSDRIGRSLSPEVSELWTEA